MTDLTVAEEHDIFFENINIYALSKNGKIQGSLKFFADTDNVLHCFMQEDGHHMIKDKVGGLGFDKVNFILSHFKTDSKTCKSEIYSLLEKVTPSMNWQDLFTQNGYEVYKLV